LDTIDRKILSALQANPNLSAADLAAQAGLSHTPCWRRVKKLEEAGVIRGKEIVFNPLALDLTVIVFAEVRLKHLDENTLENFESIARQCPEILKCFSMSGESDDLLRVVVRSVEHYEIFLKKILLHLLDVTSINSRFALKTIKMTSRLPI